MAGFDFTNSPLMNFLRGDGKSAVHSGTGNANYTPPIMQPLPPVTNYSVTPATPTTKTDKGSTNKNKPTGSGGSNKQSKKVSSYDADMAYIKGLEKRGMTPDQMKDTKAVNANNKAYKDYVASVSAKQPTATPVVTPVAAVPVGGLAAAVSADNRASVPEYANSPTLVAAANGVGDQSEFGKTLNPRMTSEVIRPNSVPRSVYGSWSSDGGEYADGSGVTSNVELAQGLAAANYLDSVPAEYREQVAGHMIAADEARRNPATNPNVIDDKDRAQMEWIKQSLYGGGRGQDNTLGGW